ncbi:MAG: sensor histidine kinase [Acidobacteriota bacterium]
MSIRLRLTLLYSGILALTLIAFSTLLYVTQSRLTYDNIKTNLERQVAGFANPRRFPGSFGEPPPGGSPAGGTGNLQGRWTQIRKLDGTVSARTPDLADTTLPLSEAGLRSVRNGTPWVETAQVDNEPLLIYSQPFTGSGGTVQIVQVASPTAEREIALGILRLILIVGSSLAIVAAFAIGWVLAGISLRPIHRLTQTAQAIGAERNFGRRVQHTGPNDEIGELAVTFNGMLTELESAYRQVQQALQAQRRFVADASHELRTPLTTIRGNIELLGHEPPIEPKEQADILVDAKDEVDRLIRLVNQLLVLARADAGRALRREPVTLEPLIEDVHRQIKLLAPDRIIVSEAAPGAAVMGDSDALKQVLLILLDNALAHTPANATISVETSVEDQCVVIGVRDTGPGIEPDRLPHIFERFYRGDVSRSGTGAGLGLSIAKELVQAQNGSLVVSSESGQGSVFTVTMPRAASSIQAQASKLP